MIRRDTWWAVARSEEVTDKKPLSTDIGDQPVVVWRDKAGIARAMEDRCPHRRAPLSLGCIRDSGFIQCGYHGWTFDGETGRLKEIPNMKDQQKFPPVYKANAYAVHEEGGFVRVALDSGLAPPVPLARAYDESGTVYVSLDHKQYLDALFDAPELVIAIRGVGFTPYPLSELRIEDGKLVMERNCRWAGPHWPAPFVSDFPLSLTTRTDPITGETEFTLRDARFADLLYAIAAPVPAARGVTAIRWRSVLGQRAAGAKALVLRGRKVFSVLDSVDGAKLRSAKPSVSLHGEELTNQILADRDTVAAVAA
jgi:nitrite reductase/ring-hydroxylating ferredoxin subunit